jgi:hypothetical protein
MGKAAFIHVAKRDALFGAVGITTSILEVALIATHQHFGANALEWSFVVQILLSLVIETTIGMFCLRLGPARTTILGMGLKTLAVITLILCFWVAGQAGPALIWGLLVLFFVLDSAGSGCLVPAFRPAYAEWYARRAAPGEALDFLAILTHGVTCRIGLPLVVLLFSFLIFANPDGYALRGVVMPAGALILFIMLAIRLYPFCQTLRDLAAAPLALEPPGGAASPAPLYCHGILVEAKAMLLMYVTGNLAFLAVMLYFIGIIFKLFQQFSMSFLLGWLGGSTVGFLVYGFSTLAAILLLPRLGQTISILYLVAALFACSCSTFFVIYFNLPLVMQILFLSAFCLVGILVGNGCQRYVSNEVIRTLPERSHQGFFLVGEILTGVIILICVLAAQGARLPSTATLPILFAQGALCLWVLAGNTRMIRAVLSPSRLPPPSG